MKPLTTSTTHMVVPRGRNQFTIMTAAATMVVRTRKGFFLPSFSTTAGPEAGEEAANGDDCRHRSSDRGFDAACELKRGGED